MKKYKFYKKPSIGSSAGYQILDKAILSLYRARRILLVAARGILLAVVISMAFGSHAFAYDLNPETDKEKKIDMLILEGLDYIHKGEYGESYKTFFGIREIDSESPVSYFYTSAALLWIMTDYRNFYYVEEFNAEVAESIERSKALIEKNKDDAWAFFYLGASYGFRGLKSAKYGQYIKAFTDGLRGLNRINKVGKLNPAITDVLYATGSYNFWKAHFSYVYLDENAVKEKILKSFSLLEHSAKEGKYTTLESEAALLNFSTESEQYDYAITLGEDIISRYPKYIYCLWYLGRSYIGKAKLEKNDAMQEFYVDKAIKNFNNILAILEDSQYATPFSFLEVAYYIAYAKSILKQASPALPLASKSFKDLEQVYLDYVVNKKAYNADIVYIKDIENDMKKLLATLKNE